jgi:hypothetical protein
MKRYLQVITVACLVALLGACSSSTKDIVKGSWTVARLTMAGAAQDPELFGPFVYDLNGDGSYNYTEGVKKESGNWSLSEDQKHLQFEPANGEKYTKDIKSASKDSVVLSFKSFTMDVNHVLVPSKK